MPISLDKKSGQGRAVERIAIRKPACVATQRRRAPFGDETTRIAFRVLKARERGAEDVEKTRVRENELARNADGAWDDRQGRSDMEQSGGLAFVGGGAADVIGAGRGVGAHGFWGGVDNRLSGESALNTKQSPASESAPREAWLRAHEELVKLARKRAGLDFEEGRWMLCAFRDDAHARLGFGSFAEYVERLFGYGPRLTREKLRVAEALEALPITSKGLRDGKVSFSAVRELTRVATAGTEGEWLDTAREKTVREVEELVSGQRPGALPGDLPDSGARRHVLRIDVSAEVLATFREAMTKIRRDAGEALDDAALFFFSHGMSSGLAERVLAETVLVETTLVETRDARTTR